MTNKGISRRRFMKDGFSLMAGTSLAFGVLSRSDQEKRWEAVSRTSLKSLLAIPTTCRQCPAGCGVIAYLNGDRLVQVLGNPDHPNNRGGICAKGIEGINLVNDPERLLSPLKRVGPRGQNKWSKITWDEAYHTLSTRLGVLIKEGRVREFVFDVGRWDPILREFIQTIGEATVLDRPALKNVNFSSAFASMTGFSSFIPDVVNSRTVLNFGANPFANHDYYVGFAQRLALSRVEKGTRLITFDVRMSETAARSDDWYPVKAGSDGIVALALAHLIVKNEWADAQFLQSHAHVSREELRQHLSRFTPQRAEKESGIAQKDLERLAYQFASQLPSVAILGGGAYDHANGYQNTKCISLLNWLTGNAAEKGGIFFPRWPMERSPDSSKTPLSQREGRDTLVDTYFSYLSNPVYSEPECRKKADLFKDEKATPFLVVMDTHMTETAILADLVLPAATYLEGWCAEASPPLDGIPILSLQQPVVTLLSPAEALRSPSFDTGKLMEHHFRPRGEAKEIGNVCLKLARDLGGMFKQKLPFKDSQDYTAKKIAAALPGADSFRDIKQRGFWMGDKSSTKASLLPKSNGQFPLPVYTPIPSGESKSADRFILTTFKTNLGTSGTENSKWAREIFHENRLWLNKGKAAQLGIKNGDKVRVSSSVGSVILRVLTTNRIHPGSVALAEGVGHTAFGKVAQARKSRTKDRDTALVWWSESGAGVNPFEIIENRSDPEAGGVASKDTVVQIQKAEE